MTYNSYAYPYPTYSMTLNKIDEPTIKISFEFIKEFEKDKTFTTTTHEDIKSGKVKSGTIIGHCFICKKISPKSNSTLNYQDKEYKGYVYCICCDCVNKYDENKN